MAKTKLMIKIHNAETGEVTEREYNKEEYAQYELDAAKATAEKAEAEAKATAKGAILDRIGLTADELKTILG